MAKTESRGVPGGSKKYTNCLEHHYTIVPGPLFEMEDGQQGRQGGHHGEHGQTEVVAKRSLGVVQERQRNEERHKYYFLPDGHGRQRILRR